MARKAASFSQTNVTRAIKAVRDGGLVVVRTEIAPDGTIRLIHQTEVTSADKSPFDEWKAKRDAR